MGGLFCQHRILWKCQIVVIVVLSHALIYLMTPFTKQLVQAKAW